MGPIWGQFKSMLCSDFHRKFRQLFFLTQYLRSDTCDFSKESKNGLHVFFWSPGIKEYVSMLSRNWSSTTQNLQVTSNVTLIVNISYSLLTKLFSFTEGKRERKNRKSVTKKFTVKTSKSERMPWKILMWEDQLGLRKNLPFVASKAKCKVILHEHNFRCIEQVRE